MKLETGQLFTYYGPRRFPYLKRGVAIGCILGFEYAQNIVFIRTYDRDSEANSTPKVEIGFLPILYSYFKKSLHKMLDENIGRVSDAETLIQTWKLEHKKGCSGAFSEVIWRSERLAWETFHEYKPNASIHDYGIAVAYPIKNSNGEYSIVRIESYTRAANQGVN